MFSDFLDNISDAKHDKELKRLFRVENFLQNLPLAHFFHNNPLSLLKIEERNKKEKPLKKI